MNDLVLSNALFNHKKSRRMTCISPDGLTRNQIEFILVQKKFRSSLLLQATRSFRGTDFGSDHHFAMMSMRLKLRKNKPPQKSGGVRYNLEKLKDSDALIEFKARIGGRFEMLLQLEDVLEMTDKFTEAINNAATESWVRNTL